MNTEALDKCLHLLNYSMDYDQAKIDILSNMETDFHKDYVQPFRRELGLNLLSKVTFSEKKDLIIFYIDELDMNASISEFYENIEPVDLETDGLLYPIWYTGQYETDNVGVSAVRAHYLFVLLFYEIQYYCNLYHIPFLEICDDRFFDLRIIDLDPTLVNMECQNIISSSMTEKSSLSIEEKPIFLLASIQQVYRLLKEYFTKEDQEELLKIIQSGKNANKPLVFLESGNRLADAYKKLYEGEIIRGCKKKELEKWIRLNFVYSYRGEQRKFKEKYLNDIISTNKFFYKTPILKVDLDKKTGDYTISKCFIKSKL